MPSERWAESVGSLRVVDGDVIARLALETAKYGPCEHRRYLNLLVVASLTDTSFPLITTAGDQLWLPAALGSPGFRSSTSRCGAINESSN